MPLSVLVVVVVANLAEAEHYNPRMIAENGHSKSMNLGKREEKETSTLLIEELP